MIAHVVSCIREKCTIDTLGHRRERFADRQLKSAHEMERLFARYLGDTTPVARSIDIARACSFDLEQLTYTYPDEIGESGLTPQQELERLTWVKAPGRYPEGTPDAVRTQLEHELRLIGELNYAPYFLTVHSIVAFARSKDILCQGRGSAANSAVCFVLGITSIDPVKSELLFERFVSTERREPPDIDVDFEHERREEVIQWIYETYEPARASPRLPPRRTDRPEDDHLRRLARCEGRSLGQSCWSCPAPPEARIGQGRDVHHARGRDRRRQSRRVAEPVRETSSGRAWRLDDGLARTGATGRRRDPRGRPAAG
jgi:hypothetical protein